MERITKPNNDDIRNKAISIIRDLNIDNNLSSDELSVLSAMGLIERLEYQKLKYYEDLEEQGKLKELPCAVGDMAYQVINLNNKFQVEPVIITELAYNMNDYYKLIGYRTIVGGEIHYSSNAIGRTLFFTSGEAEAKLKEMEGAE